MSNVLAYYRWVASIYDLTRWAVLPGRRLAVDALGLRPGDTVLEIGVGTGHNLPKLSECVGPAGRVLGLDFSPHMLLQARRRIRRHSLSNVSLICSDAGRLALSRQVDAVLLSYSLSMLPDPQKVLDLVLDVMDDAGRLTIVDFGPFRHWGPLGSAMKAWLGLNHVTVRTDDLSLLTDRFSDLQNRPLLMGYASLLVASR